MRLWSSWRSGLDVASAIVMLLAGSVVLWKALDDRKGAPPLLVEKLPAQPISVAGAASKGSAAAQVIVIEFSDFQCPYCAKFEREILPEIDRTYLSTGKVRLFFRHLPLLQIHPFAARAAEAAECAGRQGRFWQMHDILFARSPQLQAAVLKESAEKAGVDITTFESCLDKEGAAVVQRDLAMARDLGINGTPTFLFGRSTSEGSVRVSSRSNGIISVSTFRQALDPLIRAVRP